VLSRTPRLRDVVPHVAACGPHQRPHKSCSSARKDFFNSICQQRTHTCSNRRRVRQRRRPKHSPTDRLWPLSEAETQSDRGSMLLWLEKAEAQPACTWLNIMPK